MSLARPMSLVRRITAAALLIVALPMLQAQTPSKSTQSATAAKAQAAQKNTAESGDKLDINTATADQLKTFSGIGDAYAKRIIDGRPYAQKTQLATRGILPQATYDKIKDKIVASRPKK